MRPADQILCSKIGKAVSKNRVVDILHKKRKLVSIHNRKIFEENQNIPPPCLMTTKIAVRLRVRPKKCGAWSIDKPVIFSKI
jgi:hypothetical protein